MIGKEERGAANDILSAYPQLLEIPEDKFRQVVQFLDSVQHKNEVRQVLDHVRDRITRLKPPRQPSLRRLFYLPAEDFLVHDRRSASTGLIARIAMPRAWSYVSSQLGDETAAEAAGKLKAIDPRDIAAINEVGTDLWPKAAAILRAAIERSREDKTFRHALLGGEPELMTDIENIAQVLEVASAIQTLKGGLPPRPMGEPTPQHLETLRYLIKDCSRQDPQAAFTILLAFAVRMDVPGNMLERLPRLLNEFGEEERGQIEERLTSFVVADLALKTSDEMYGKHIEIADRALHAGALVQSLVATERSLRSVAPIMKRDIKTIRGAAESIVGDLITEANIEVRNAVAAGPNAPMDRRMASEQNLVALRRCARYAERVGLDKKVDEALQAVGSEMRSRIDRILSAVADRGIETEEGQAPFQHWSDEERNEFIWSVRLLEISGEIEEAAAVWRRLNAPARHPH